MSRPKVLKSESSEADFVGEFEEAVHNMQLWVEQSWIQRAKLDYNLPELLKTVQSARDKIRTAISEKETYKITSSYLQASLSVVEFALYTEGKLDKRSQKLLHSCITITVENSEDTEDQRGLVVFRIWIWRLMLQIDSVDDLPVNFARVRSILEYQKKIHQKYFDHKLYSVWIAYTEAKRSGDPELQQEALSVMKDFNSVLSLQMGGVESSIEKSNLRFAAFVRSLEISAGSKELFAMMVVVTKLLILARNCPEITLELLEDNTNKIRNIILTYLKENEGIQEIVEQTIELIHTAVIQKQFLIVLTPNTELSEKKVLRRANRYYLKKKISAIKIDNFIEDHKQYEQQKIEDSNQSKQNLLAKGISESTILKRILKNDTFDVSSSYRKVEMIARTSSAPRFNINPSRQRPDGTDSRIKTEAGSFQSEHKFSSLKTQTKQIAKSLSRFQLTTSKAKISIQNFGSNSMLTTHRTDQRSQTDRGLMKQNPAEFVMIESTRESNKASQPTFRNYTQMKDLIKSSLKEVNKVVAKGVISVTEDVIIDPDFKSSTQRRNEDWQTLKYKLIRMRWIKNKTKPTTEETPQLIPEEVIKYPPQFMLLDRPIKFHPKVRTRQSISPPQQTSADAPTVDGAATSRGSQQAEKDLIRIEIDESFDSISKKAKKPGPDLMQASSRTHKLSSAGDEPADATNKTAKRGSPVMQPVKTGFTNQVKKVLTLNRMTSVFKKDKSKFNPETAGTTGPAADQNKQPKEDSKVQGDGFQDMSSIMKPKVGDTTANKLRNLLPRPIESSESEGDGTSVHQEGISLVKSKQMSVGKSELHRGDKTFRGLGQNWADNPDNTLPEYKWAQRRILRLETNKDREEDSDQDTPDEEQIRMEQSLRFVSQNSLNRKKLNGRKPTDGLVKEIQHNHEFRTFMKTFLNGLEIILVSNRSFAMRHMRQVFYVGERRGLRRLNTMEAVPSIMPQVEVYNPNQNDQLQPGETAPSKRNSKVGNLLSPAGTGNKA